MNLNAENRIRRSLLPTRLIIGYTPTNVVRWLQNITLHLPPLTQGVRTRNVVANGVPCEWFEAHKDANHPVVLYLHGGGFVFGVSAMHRQMLADITHAIQGRALMVDYRLAPEYPFPAALDDCLAAYRWLLDQGIPPQRIIIAGDSAGGNLTLALLIKLRDMSEPLPAAGVCLSPAPNLTKRDEDEIWSRSDEILHPRALVKFREAYVGNNNSQNPLISPLFADLSNLPPLLIFAGGDEILCEDIEKFAKAAQAVGTSLDLKVYPRMWHVWQLSGKALPQTTQSLSEIAAFIREHQP